MHQLPNRHRFRCAAPQATGCNTSRTPPSDDVRCKKGRGLNLALLRKPQPRYDLRDVLPPDRHPLTGAKTPGFENRRKARAEDRKRVEGLLRWQEAEREPRPCKPPGTVVDGFRQEDARGLIARLERRHSGQLPRTFASYMYMRQYRRGFCASVLSMLDGVPESDIRLFTIVPHTWRIAGDQLAGLDPKKLLEQFRAQLNRAGLGEKSGGLIAFVHGEYDPTYDVFQLHLHVVVVGTKAKAVENLRRHKLYQPTDHIAHPIIPRGLKDRPRQISYYLAQSFWPSKPTLTIDGRERRKRTRDRIPEPRHAEVLMWLDRQTFADFVWLHGCAIRDGHLVPTLPKRPKPR